MKRIEVKTPHRAYPIIIDTGLRASFGRLVAELCAVHHLRMITAAGPPCCLSNPLFMKPMWNG